MPESTNLPNTGEDVVTNLQYGREYLDSLREAQRTGECPFCKPERQNEALCRRGMWGVFLNHYPTKDRDGENPAHHLLFICAMHRDDVAPLTGMDWQDIGRLIEWCREAFPGANGGGLVFRDGDPKICGRTVRHPHAHYVIPRVNDEGNVIPVYMPIG